MSHVPTMRPRAVIIGAGIAGVSAAVGMRAAGWDGEIVLLGDEPELPYRRPPVSKEIIRGDKTADQIRIKPEAWYVDNNVELRTGVTVVRIDTLGSKIALAEGPPITFDRLLLATGGTARALVNPDGSSAAGVRTLRTLADVPRLQQELTAGKRLIVVGAGLIGSEIAASARTLGCEVTLLETASLPLPRLLPPLLGQMYADLHKRNGTDLHTDVTVESIVDEGGLTVVRAVDGRTWSAPIVVVAIGMQPSTGLAEAAGIDVSNGIVVDASGQTSAPGIYAAGDVANQPNAVLGGRHRVEHWQNAQNHGTAVGKAMAGAESTFVEVPWCWSDQYDVNLQVTGWPEAGHDVHVRGSIDARNFSAFFLKGGGLDNGVIVGAVAIGRPGDVRQARKWIAASERLDPAVLTNESADLADSVMS